MDSYTYLRVKGEIAYADLKTISTLPQLTTLHIDADIVEDNDCGGIFSGSRIETICSTSFPQGMLTGMPRLTTVISCRKGEKMPEGIMEEAGNPNLLIWVESADDAPSGAGNVVVYTADGEGSATDPAGNGVEGHAASIALKAGSPFNAHMPLTADFIKVEKEFTLPTEVDVCAGWETLTLPFAPDSIIHENSGRIIPFSNWDESNLNGPKPFWLYRADGGDWEAASDIEAGIPYIISMPNSQDYVEAFNLAGKVTFLANDVTIGTEDTFPAVTDWKDGATFEGTFMPVEENDILSLNVNATEEGVYPGSAFVADDETLPFGAFVRASGSRKSIPVFDSGNGVQLPTVSADGLRVESPAPGMLRISTSRVCNTAIVTPEGAVVRKLRLQAGDTQTVEGLTRGVYIVAGLKVMVK